MRTSHSCPRAGTGRAPLCPPKCNLSRKLNIRVTAALGSAGLCTVNAAASFASRPGTTLVPARGRHGARAARTSVVANVFEKFTERSIKAVMIGQQEAKNFGSQEVSTEHILLGLIAEDTNSKHGYLNAGLTSEKAKAMVEALSGRRAGGPPLASDASVSFSRDVKKTFEAATNECKRAGVNYIAPEHILVAMLSLTDCGAKKVLHACGVEGDALKTEAIRRLNEGRETDASKKKKAGEKEGPKALEEFCTDLCAEVRRGRIDPVIGRETEVLRLAQILARRTKNNPILLGEPGVGKTAIGEGLAYAIVHRQHLGGAPLPEFLHDKRILQLDLGLMIAGAKERGELESRVTRLLAEVKEARDVVLMIDEVHTLVGAGSVGRGGGGGLDVSNLLKPALARGELQCIGATTVDEHRKYIERDTALERRFQPVYVNEPNEREALAILQGLKERYERHHRCTFTDEALEAAVALSARYIADRQLPDKAIDLMDEAGSKARIAAHSARRSLRLGESPKLREYLQVLAVKDEAVKDGLYEEAGILHKREVDYRVELSGDPADGVTLPVVNAQDIESIVAAWTGIPVERMNADEKSKLLGLSGQLKDRVIGQDDAADSVATALCRSRSGLKDPNRPIACLLFVGPTGVGKTELTKALADVYFGSPSSMIRLDMSEYMERHSVSKLIGAPPGYVGYGEGGKLTEAVRRRPSSIVLFDEVEKAHPDVFSLLLQIMEDGRLTDSAGRVVSFKNTLVVLTSNIGSRVIAASGLRSGVFIKATEEAAEREAAGAAKRLRTTILEEVKSYFRPELLNRFDEQVVFNKLGRREAGTIAGLMLAETQRRVAERGYGLEVSAALMDKIVSEGYSDEYGARPLRNAMTRLIDDTLSDAILNGRLARGATAYMDVDSDGAVTVCDKAAVTTVAGHDSGYNGRIRIEDYRESNGSGSGPGSVKGAWAPPRNPVPVDAQQRDY